MAQKMGCVSASANRAVKEGVDAVWKERTELGE